MRDDGQPPTDDEIKECVEKILHGADLEQITMKMVYNQVYSYYPDCDLTHKKDFIRTAIKSNINTEPTSAQMEKLMNFLEENPEIAKGTNQANNAHERLQMTQKWDAVAKELNLMGGANRSGNCWATVWNVSRNHINRSIADRKSATGARGDITQPHTPEIMERMISLLEGLGIEEIPAESPSTSIVTNVTLTAGKARPPADLPRRARRCPQTRSAARAAWRRTRMRPVMTRRRVVMNPSCPQTKAMRPPTTINSEPTIAQMEKLVKFLEENPEIATRTDQATNAQASFQTTQKWEAIAHELNLMGGANRSGYSWAELWDVSRSHISDIIADRKCTTGARGGIIQPHTPEIMERMISLLEGLGIEEIPAESPSDDEIKNYVKQILDGANLEQITMKIVCEQVFSHYPDFDLAHKRDFIKATVKSMI